MAWRRLGDKPLSEPMMVCLSTHICVNRPQWVNDMQCHCNDVTWTPWRLKSLVTPPFARPFVQAYITKTHKKASRFRVAGRLLGNPPVIGGFLSQTDGNTEMFSMSWRHHVLIQHLRTPSTNFYCGWLCGLAQNCCISLQLWIMNYLSPTHRCFLCRYII